MTSDRPLESKVWLKDLVSSGEGRQSEGMPVSRAVKSSAAAAAVGEGSTPQL